MKTSNGLYKVFHTLVPLGGINLRRAEAVRFASTCDGSAHTFAELAAQNNDFRFYTQTLRTEPLNSAPFRAGSPYAFEGVDVFAFDTPISATALRNEGRAITTDFLDPASAWLLTKEHVGINGPPKGPLDTGRGVKIVTSMKRKSGISPKEFREHWADGARYVAATQGISRYTTNYVVDSEYEIAEPPVDGFVEVWFRTFEDARISFTDPLFGGLHRTHNDLYIDVRSFFTIQCIDAERWVSGGRAEGERGW